MPFKIIRNDITKMEVDVIVNTANPKPIFSTGTDRAVYDAAGVLSLLEERKKIGPMAEGEVAITPGFLLPAKYIIHAVSPNFHRGEKADKFEKLRLCYRNSLDLALTYQCQSIAFPLISTGNLGCPKEEGLRIAVDEINAFLLQHSMLVYLVVFDAESTKLGTKLNPALDAYIDQHYVEKQTAQEYGEITLAQYGEATMRLNRYDAGAHLIANRAPYTQESLEEGFLQHEQALSERIEHLSDTFQEYLIYLIELKKLKNAEVYNRALVTKQLFSKIKKNKDYHPDKATAMRLCVGAKLNLDETKDLLLRAGYALSPSDKRDIIFSFFIEKGIHDMIEIDIKLEEYGLPCFIK